MPTMTVCAMAVAVVRTQCLLHILLRDVGEGFKHFVDTCARLGSLHAEIRDDCFHWRTTFLGATHLRNGPGRLLSNGRINFIGPFFDLF